MQNNTEIAAITGFSIYWCDGGTNWFMQEGSTRIDKSFGAISGAMHFDTDEAARDFIEDLGNQRKYFVHDNSLPAPAEPDQSSPHYDVVKAAHELLDNVGFYFEAPKDPRPYIDALKNALTEHSKYEFEALQSLDPAIRTLVLKECYRLQNIIDSLRTDISSQIRQAMAVYENEPIGLQVLEYLHATIFSPCQPIHTEKDSVSCEPALQTSSSDSVDQMTKNKTDALKLQGSQVVGYVLRKDGEEIAICAQGAVRWLKEPQYWDLMHPSSEIKLNGMDWSIKYGITVLDPDGWDRTNYEASWAELLTEADFKLRLSKSSSIKMPPQHNAYGLDAPYFTKNLQLILEGIGNYTPQEMARALVRLAKTSDDIVAKNEMQPEEKAVTPDFYWSEQHGELLISQTNVDDPAYKWRPAYSASPPASQTVNKTQDPKYNICNGRLVNAVTGIAIPTEEPLFILRGKDKQAYEAIHYYATLCNDLDHIDAVHARTEDFRMFSVGYSGMMKEPDTAFSQQA
ncbi:MAG: hypothetical protein Q7K13_05905 [Polynucleobacter sp.]|uniref:hypothetical protein n=1 Tax=Polynucleobacter sp. TaxID=2029855 RepID=UPI002719F086|nr:hypothetical protein [Polynucleobacter sp.]MDO8713996.1 hypothetical protein [Polynucleobacter sp.]